jgi:hypothetical protein
MSFTGPARDFNIWLESLTKILFSIEESDLPRPDMPGAFIEEDSGITVDEKSLSSIDLGRAVTRRLSMMAADCLSEDGIPIIFGHHPGDAEFKRLMQLRQAIQGWCTFQYGDLSRLLYTAMGWKKDPRALINDVKHLLEFSPGPSGTAPDETLQVLNRMPVSMDRVISADVLLARLASCSAGDAIDLKADIDWLAETAARLPLDKPWVHVHGQSVANDKKEPLRFLTVWHADWAVLATKVNNFVAADICLPALGEPLVTRLTDDKTVTEINAALHAKAKKSKKKPKHRANETIELSGVKSNLKLDHGYIATEMPELGRTLGRDENVSHEDMVFVPHTQHITLVAQPGHSVPYINNKRVAFKDIKGNKDVVWREVEPEGFYPVGTFDRAFLAVLFDMGYMTQTAYQTLLDSGAVPDSVPNAVKPLLEEEVISKGLDKKQVGVARVLLYAGLACKLLREADLASKVPFAEKWFKRLLDVPDPIDPLPTARRFYTALRHAVKSNTPVNKVFYGFLMGNLANWKQGELKTEMIERCTPSVKFYWQDQAATYISEFKKLDLPFIKTKGASINRKLLQLAEKRAKDEGAKALSSIKNPGETWAKVVQKANNVTDSAHTLAKEAARFGYYEWCLSRLNKTAGYIKARGLAAKEQGLEVFNATSATLNLKKPDPVEVCKYLYHRTLHFWQYPFKTEARQDTINGDGTEILVEFTVTDRHWWSYTKASLKKIATLPLVGFRKLIAYKRHIENGVDDVDYAT